MAGPGGHSTSFFPGPRADSLFASNTSNLKQGEDLDFLRAIGMKVERAHFAPPVQTVDPHWAVHLPPGAAVALDFSKQDKAWELTKAHDLWALPIVGYSLASGSNFDRTNLAENVGMYGPPGDEQRFINTWETILRHYPEITTYEFWNEPWIFEWNWSFDIADRQISRPDFLSLCDRSGAFRRSAGPLPGMAESAENRYPVTLMAKVVNDGSQSSEPEYSSVIRDQVIAVAKFAKQTIKMSGSPDDWTGITPVMMDSQQFENGRDPTSSLLNPKLEQSPGMANHPQIVARVYTAYDDSNVYLGAVVHEDQFRCSAGQPVSMGPKDSKITLPYKEGMPDGLHYITTCGNVLQFSFGFRDRVPGIGRQMSDPWAWKGCFYDTDYSFVAHVSTEGDQLIRIWGPDGSRQDGYQTEAVPGIGPVPGGKVMIKRDEDQKLTIYEIAIPRHELALFDPAAERCRFGFILYNSEQAASGSMNWSDAAGCSIIGGLLVPSLPLGTSGCLVRRFSE
jgi:hypothetical protein